MRSWVWFHRWRNEYGARCWALYLGYGTPLRITIIHTPKQRIK